MAKRTSTWGNKEGVTNIGEEIQRRNRENKGPFLSLPVRLSRRIESSIDHTQFSLSELVNKISPELQRMITFEHKNKRITLEEWINSYRFIEDDTKFNNPIEESILYENEGKFYRNVIVEILILIRIAESIKFGGDLEKYVEEVHFYWDLWERGYILSVAGMSSGGEIALAVNEVFPIWNSIRIADPKPWHPILKNRILYSSRHEGRNKTEYRKEQIHESTPWTFIEAFEEGVTPENARDFLDGAYVVFDQMDDPEMKIGLRMVAREMGVPLVMITILGNRVLREIRRFDLDRNLSLFASISDDDLNNELRKIDNIKNLDKDSPNGSPFIYLSEKIIGAQFVPDDFRAEAICRAQGRVKTIRQNPEVIDLSKNIARQTMRNLFKGIEMLEQEDFMVTSVTEQSKEYDELLLLVKKAEEQVPTIDAAIQDVFTQMREILSHAKR